MSKHIEWIIPVSLIAAVLFAIGLVVFEVNEPPSLAEPFVNHHGQHIIQIDREDLKAWLERNPFAKIVAMADSRLGEVCIVYVPVEMNR